MPRSTTLTVKLPVQVKARLDQLAQSTGRPAADLASRVIEEYLDIPEWQVKAIEDAILEAGRLSIRDTIAGFLKTTESTTHEADAPDPAFYDHEEVETKLRHLIAKRRELE